MKKRRTYSIRALRLSRGLSMEEVAAQTGIPYSTVRALEIGTGRNFNPILKHKLSDFYGANFFDFYPEERERLEFLMEQRHRRKSPALEGRTVQVQEFVGPVELKKN